MANVYFFQRLRDKEVFFCESQEADINMKKTGLKYLGVSDGKVFEKVMAELPKAILSGTKELTMLRRRCEAIELKISELMGSSAPQAKIDALQKTLDEQIGVWENKQTLVKDVENEYRNKAIATELVVAKKNKKEVPPDNSWAYFGDVDGAKKAVNQKRYA